MMVPEHTDALAPTADATVNFRLGTWTGPRPGGEPAAIPHVLGRYRVLGEIARGGMGVVLLAYDDALDRELAIKLLSPNISPDSEAGRRFAQEARVAGHLDHPGIIPIYESGSLPDGRTYFVMPVVRGCTLASLLADRPNPRHDLNRWLTTFERVCVAIAYAHAKGVVHRDLKPANVMLGEFGQVVVMDWGVAAVGPSPTTPDNGPGFWVFGTPAYMAPEQARGAAEADPRADIFGLGAVLCEILTGHPPFLGSGAATATQQAVAGDLGEACARLAKCGAHPALIALARECLSPDPADRPADAGAIGELVAHFVAGQRDRPEPIPPTVREPWSRRVASLLTAAAAVTASALAGATARDLHARAADRGTSPPAWHGVTPTPAPPPAGPACPPSAASS
jgi:eukaryotic-like serine/threonine-protein kinase